MCADKGMLKGSRWLEGYVKPLSRPWKKVAYADVDGLAIFEGCIILGKTAELEESRLLMEQRVQAVPELLTQPGIGTLGIAISGRQYRWPNRTLPYEIDPSLPDQKRIHDAIRHWEDRTTIAFRPRGAEPDYIYFRRVASGCASMVGRRGGRQELILADSCEMGHVIHELGHAIGLWHEQSRQDRGRYIRIIQSNVDPDFWPNFEQHILDGDDLGPYDYGSIMHYPRRAFSVDGESETIQPLQPLPPGVAMGQRLALSIGDISAAEKIYADEPMPHA